jgi:hypothetical protein
MAGLSGFTPDDIYCAYCHAKAAGRCASCRALVCADCAELVGSAKRFAVCSDCHAKGAGRAGLAVWASLLWPVALLVFGALLVALLVAVLAG